MGRLWVLYLALGALFAAGLGVALWALVGSRQGKRPAALRTWAWYEAWVCLAGLGTILGRFLGWSGWSARIWPYTLALLAVIGCLAYALRGLRLPGWLASALRVLALKPLPASQQAEVGPPSNGAWIALGLATHLAGLALLLGVRYQWPLWTVPVALFALLTPQAPVVARRRRLQLAALAPLYVTYAAAGIWLVYRSLDITIIGWQGLAFPNPMTSLFYLDGILLASVTYALLCHLAVLATAFGRRAILWRGAVVALLLLTLAWSSVVYFGKRTHGATASDPFAYAQMGVDLAERGSFLHRYTLFQEVMPLQIAWAPLQPVGYHIPRNEQGDCPSVWATGASVLLAAGYKLMGEAGLYVTTPAIGLMALVATWLLVQETLKGTSLAVRYLTGSLAVALLATSPEHVDRLLVPMADAPAQLFTILTLLFALRGMHQLQARRRSTWPFLLAGASFGWAYWVRHTQLVLALPVILAAVVGGVGNEPVFYPNVKREAPSAKQLVPTLLSLLCFFAAALIAALPDIIYRWQIFGGLFATETTELPLMGLQHIGPVGWQMLRDMLAAGEWGYLFPLMAYGTYRLAGARPKETIVLGSAFLAVLTVHLTYQSLRLRDLISLFPLLNLAVAYGTVVLVQKARSVLPNTAWKVRLGRALLPATVISWIVLSLALSRWTMIDNLWKPGWASFGYMRAEQRAAFDRLAELTPEEAVIGASLNAGAIAMYTGREAIRPYDSWTNEEWTIFLEEMQANRRPVYLLDDGGLMAEFIEKDRSQHRLTPVEELEVPLFYTRDRDTGWLYRLEWNP